MGLKERIAMSSIREKMISVVDLPKDVVLGMSILTVLGNNEICIENYRGIIEYTDTLIRVQTKEKQIKIQGKRLQIEYYTNDEMKIKGYIHSIEYCK